MNLLLYFIQQYFYIVDLLFTKAEIKSDSFDDGNDATNNEAVDQEMCLPNLTMPVGALERHEHRSASDRLRSGNP